MPQSVPLSLEGKITNISQLERQVAQIGKKAGRNLKINLGTNAKDIKSLEQPLGRITGKADEFTKSMEAANARVLAFGASVGIINSVVQSFKALVSTTIEVEASLAKINSILKTTTSGLNDLKGQIFDIARNTEQTFSTVAEAALELSRQGLSATEVTKRLNDALILSRLSGINAAEAVAGLTAAVNSFSKAGLTTGEVLNKISNAANQFAVSERDLIEGFKRSASVAEQAGVSIDELGGIITAVQQKTARGGAVIGNSFKTIFTRIGRAENLDLLQSIGVQITDIQGRILPATKLIENLAQQLEKLDDVQVRSITEKIGGGFQIAPLLAALSDYSSETSIAIRATEAFRTATDQAYQKNIVLNQTLSAAINTTTLSIQELANKLGELGVTDTFREILNFFNNFAQKAREILDGEGFGGTFARGIVKGLSNVLIKGGIALFGILIIKLTAQLAKFGIDSLKTFLNIGKEAQRLKGVQDQIVSTLLSDKGIRDSILKIESSSLTTEQKRLQQANLFNAALRERAALNTQIRDIGVGIGPRVLGVSRGLTRRGASGYLPVGAEQSDISKGVGGAPRGAKPVVIPNFAFGKGQRGTMVANSSEYIVPNFAGGGSAIFNQDMVKSMGLPSGAKKINAAGGYIPNFVSGATYLRSKGATITGYTQGIISGKIGNRDLQKGVTVGGESYSKEQINEIRKSAALKRDAANVETFNTYVAEKDPKKSIMLIPDRQKLQPNASNVKFAKPRRMRLGGKNRRVDQFVGSIAGVNPNLNENSKFVSLLDVEKKISENITDATNSTLFQFKDLVGLDTDPVRYSDKQVEQLFLKEGGAGAVGALKGAIFEGLINAITGGIKQDQDNTLDVKFSGQGGKELEEIFGLSGQGYEFGDFKSSGSKKNKNKFITQTLNNLPKALEKRILTRREKLAKEKVKKASGGYIPNYAASMSPLEDAIQREKDAGVPVNQIRINQNGKLRNSQNPNGLAVTNTRDEPTGRIPQNAAGGYVPNFQQGIDFSQKPRIGPPEGLGKAAQDVNGKLISLSLAAGFVQQSFAAVSQESEGFGKNIADAGDGLFGLITTLTALNALNINVGRGSGLLAGFSKGGGTGKIAQLFSKIGAIGPKVVGVFKFLGGGLLKLVPVAGQLLLAFQGVSAIFKLFGVDVTQKVGEALGLIETPADKAAKSLAKLSEESLKAAIATGKASEKPFEDFLNKINVLSENALKEKLSESGKKKVGQGATASEVILSEAIGESVVKGLAGKKIFEALGDVDAAAVSTPKDAVSKEKARQRIRREAERQIVEGQNVSGGRFTGVGTSSGKVQAFKELNFAFAQAFGTEEQFKKIIDLVKSGDKKAAGGQIEAIIGGLPPKTKKEYEDLIEKISKLNLADPEDQKQLANLLKPVKEIADKNERSKQALEKIKTVRADIAKIQREFNIQAAFTLANIKTEAEFAQDFLIASTKTTQVQKDRAKTTLASINSEKKLRQDLAKSFKETLEGEKLLEKFKEKGNAAGRNEVETQKIYNNLIEQSVQDVLAGKKITAEEFKQRAEGLGLYAEQADLQKETLDLINAKAESLTKENRLALAINNIQEARTRLNQIELQQEKQKEEAFRRRLDLITKEQDIDKEIRGAEDRLAKANIDARAIFGGQGAKFSATQQKAAIDRASLQDNLIKDQQRVFADAAREFFDRAVQSGVTPTDEIKTTLESVVQGNANEINNLVSQLNEANKKQIKERRDAAIEQEIAEINNILAMKTSVDLFGEWVRVLTGLTLGEPVAGNQTTPEGFLRGIGENIINNQTGFIARNQPNVDAIATSLTSRLSSLQGTLNKDPNTPDIITGNEFNLIEKRIKLLGLSFAAATVELENSLKEAGASLTTFANLVRGVFNAIPEQKAQNLFTLATSADPSAIQGALTDQLRIGQLEQGVAQGLSGAEAIKEANKFVALEEKRLQITSARTAAERVAATFALEKLQQQLDIAEEIADIKENDPKREEKILAIKQKIAKLENQELDFQSKLASKGLTGEEATEKLTTSLVEGADQFVNKLSDGLVDAIVLGENLGDTLRNAAFQFFNELAKASLNNVFKQIFFGGGQKGGGILGFLGNFADGGKVTGGSGVRDDVPAMLMGGEYVMKRSAVNKYGANFMEALNQGNIQGFARGGLVRDRDRKFQTGEGGFFAPGLGYGVGGESIKGKGNLLGFATQGYTTGAQDIASGYSSASGGGSFVSLEPESVRLTNFGRTLGTPLQQATDEAKQQAFGLYVEQVNLEKQLAEQEKQRKKALKNSIISAVAGFALSTALKGFAGGSENVAGGEAVKIGEAGTVNAGKFLNQSDKVLTGVTEIGQQGFLANPSIFQRLGSGFKGSIFGAKLPGGGDLTYGGLRNIFSRRGQIGSSQELFQYIQANPESDIAKQFLGRTPLKAVPVTGYSTTLKDLQNRVPTGRATGGYIPDQAGVDTVPAMLSGGEFVMNSAAADRLGRGNLERMNAGGESGDSLGGQEMLDKLDDLIEATKDSTGEINITVNGGDSEGSSSGGEGDISSEDSEKKKRMAKRIKEEVLRVIKEEKRLGGTLRNDKL